MSNDIHLPTLLSENLNVSKSEARRLIHTGAVKVGDRPLLLEDCDPRHIEGKTISVGRQKRSFVVGQDQTEREAA